MTRHVRIEFDADARTATPVAVPDAELITSDIDEYDRQVDAYNREIAAYNRAWVPASTGWAADQDHDDEGDETR